MVFEECQVTLHFTLTQNYTCDSYYYVNTILSIIRAGRFENIQLYYSTGINRRYFCKSRKHVIFFTPKMSDN